LNQDINLIDFSAATKHQKLSLVSGTDAFTYMVDPARELLAVINKLVLTNRTSND